jgi:hypothetical protein
MAFLSLTRSIFCFHISCDAITRSRFVTGEDELSTLPKDVQRIFTLVTEKDFRVDISSTEIRRQKSTEMEKHELK